MNLKPAMPSISTALLPEFDHETGTTRRLLARVPEGALSWRPHDKSMSLAELASHLARLLSWTPGITGRTMFDLAEARAMPRLAPAASVEALLALFDETAAAARATIAGQSDDDWLTVWTLRDGGAVVFTVPRISAFRTMVLNHAIHHRGQLTVYLRLQDVPLPSIYGPTADEP